MPTPTYTALATITLTSSASTITFSSIPATYRDLILIGSGKTAAAGAMGVGMRFNGDTASNYPNVFMAGDGSSTFSGSSTSDRMDIGYLDGTEGNIVGNLMDYSATDKHKTTLVRYNDSSATVVARAYRWANTAAVNSISLYNSSGNGELFGTTTTFSLYGVIS